jgi:protease-4
MRTNIAGWCAALALTCTLPLARGQAPIIEPERLPAFGRSVAGTDDTTALVQNPANLAFMPASELRWQGVYLGEDLAVPWQGHAFSLGFRLPFSLATGIRLDLIDPPARSFGPGLSNNYQWLTWGIAYAASQSAAIGLSLQRSYSDGLVARSLGSYSLGFSTRPVNAIGLSLVAHHVNGPLEGGDVRTLQQLGASGVTLGPSFDAALAVRPLGDRAVEVGLEARYLNEPEVWVPRATLGVDIPYVGRLRGDVAVSDPGRDERAWIASAGLSFYANGTGGSTDVAGGVVTGNGLGQSGSPGRPCR